MAKTIQEWFDEYAENHQNNTNKVIHWVCVPAIYFSLICLLVTLREPFHSAYIVIQAVVISAVMGFYWQRSIAIAIGMFVFTMLCFVGGMMLSHIGYPLWRTALIIFAVAWIGQFIGHKIEGKKPSFIKDLQFLLIGPAWLLSFIYKAVGIRY